MANPTPTINQINAFNATQGTTIDFNIIGGTELVRSNRIYIYDLSDNSLICTHLYVSTESIHELPANTDSSIVYESGKSSADFVNGAQYYAQIQTYTDTAGTEGGSGLSVAKMFWCLDDPTLTIDTIPSTISTTSYNVSATYNANTSVVSNIIQQYQFSLYSATGSLLQSSGVVVGNGEQQGTSTTYDISYNFTGLSVGSSYYVVVDVTTTQGMSVTTQSNTFMVSIDTPTLGEATVVNNACDGYISVTSNLSSEYGGSGSGEIVSFETDSVNNVTKLEVTLEPTQLGEGTPSPSNVRPIVGHSSVEAKIVGKNLFDIANATHAYIDGNGVLVANDSFRASDFILINPNQAYTLSYIRGQGASGSGMRIAWYDENKDFIRRDGILESVTGLCQTTATAPSNARYGRVSIYFDNSYVYAKDQQFEKGTTATTYEPYQGQTYTSTLPETVYGGTVDLVSGEMVVDNGIKTFDASEPQINFYSVDAGTNSNRIVYTGLQGAKVGSYLTFKSNAFAYELNSFPSVGFGAINNGNLLLGVPTTVTTKAEAIEYLASMNVQIVYELATPQTYQLTPQEIQTLVGTNNVWSDSGDVEITYNIPITNLLVKRQDVADVSGTWLTLYSQPITQASDMDFTFIDFLNQYGKTYKYALVPLLTQTQSGVEVEVEGGYTVSDEVQSIFDGVFIADSTGSQKCKANVGYGDVDMNQAVGTITPIGAKYPVVITNSKNQYHNGSIFGTIVPDDYYSNGNLSRIDMVNKRNELEQFLTNKRAKIIKDWNSNIWLVMIMDNINCTFNNEYGMGIVNFTANWIEVGDPTNQQDLQATGLIDVGGA